MGGPETGEFELKILALGGSGSMGQVAVKTLLAGSYFDQLIVADVNLERANSFVRSLKDERVSAQPIDVQDTKALEELMSNVDLVVNTTGPFYRFGEGIVRAAIKTGCSYIDINDDSSPTKKILQLDAEARKAEVIILIGMGASPGVTNILARHAANQLDEVDYIQTVWGHVGGILRPAATGVKRKVTSESGVQAAWEHYFECATSKAPVFRDGKYVDVIPLESGEDVIFPQGKGFFRYFGHAEPITLPHFIGKGIKGACNLVGLEPEELDISLEFAKKIRTGEISITQAAATYAQEVYKRRQQRKAVVDMGPRLGGLHASASGKKDGKKVRYGYGCLGEPPGAMGGATSIPLAIAVQMMLEGEIEQTGVLAPEACIDPIPFFQRYMKYWINPPKRVEDTLYEIKEKL